ncbi:MAG: hypothetical protein COA58_00315 [Bacteroidetes bacterium]|nr:MAG: hypothetical protein COA58_00315 [Bacteroidota bacterium]
MRFLSFIAIISLSQFTNGQNVFTKFQDTLVYDNFETNQYNFPQKYTAFELSIIENSQYRIKRLSDNGRSISYLKLDKPLYAYEVSATIEIPKSGSKNASGGIVLNGQTTSNGAILLEINNKRKFRVSKIFDEQFRYLAGNPKDNGWIKTKRLNKGGKNVVSVKFEDGYFDIYFNGIYTYTAYDIQFEDGRVGLFASAHSELLATDFLVKKKISSISKSLSIGGNGSSNEENSDPAFQEVILIFKTKIDQQQLTIASLQSEVDKCKSMLSYDTTLVSRSAELQINNRLLSSKLDSTSRELSRNKKRLIYLESLKEDIEAGSNGDLVLNLTTILANIKNDNKKLKGEASILEMKNEVLKKDNEVLLREIDRLKYMLDLKE